MTTEFNPDQCRAHIATLADKANDGCGLIYELYQRRLSGSIDAMWPRFPPSINSGQSSWRARNLIT